MPSTLPFRITADLRAQLTSTEPTWGDPKIRNAKSKPSGLGDPKLFLVTDPQIPAGWVVVYGWLHTGPTTLEESVHGDVVYRGPVSNERGPQKVLDTDYSFLTKYFKTRTVEEL